MTTMQIKETKPTDRVQVLDNPMGPPGKCIICGNGADKDRKWIDFGVTVDFLGAVYICSLCIDEVCNALNYASPEQTSKMLSQIKLTQTANRRLESERNALRTAILNLNDGGIPISVTVESSEPQPDTLPFDDGDKKAPRAEFDLS